VKNNCFSNYLKSYNFIEKENDVKTWQAIQNLDIPPLEKQFISSFVYEGTPYVAFVDAANQNRISVKKYNQKQNTWEFLGQQFVSHTYSSYPSLWVYYGVPFIAYQDWEKNGLSVKMFNGKYWQLIGRRGFSNGEALDIALTVHKGVPYVTFCEGTLGNKVSVMKYNGKNWTYVGKRGFSQYSAYYPVLSIYKGIPYIAYGRYGKKCKLEVRGFNHKYWVPIGNNTIPDDVAFNFSLCVEAHVPHLAYYNAINKQITVLRYQRKQWEKLSTKGLTKGIIFRDSLNVHKSHLVLAYLDKSTDQQARVMQYTNNEWQKIGQACLFTKPNNKVLIQFCNKTPFLISYNQN
jgi:hypothetical protein